jgi:tetratricopeptide (TPR) repeat protein
VAAIESRLARRLGNRATLLAAKADALAALGRRRNAVEAMLAAERIDAESSRWRRLVEIDPEAAVSYLDARLVEHPRDFEELAYLSEAHRRLGHAERARDAIDRYLAAYPNWTDADEAVFIAASDPETRLPLLKWPLVPGVENAWHWVRWGVACEALGRRAEALDAYDHAIKLAPDDLDAFVHWCRLR